MNTNKNVEYFSHDYNACDDPKIMLMMAQLGLEAYGIYWILIEYLRQQPDYKAPLILMDPISRRYGSSKEKFETVITRFDLFIYDDKYFWSPSLIRRMSWLDSKREKLRNNARMRWSENTNALQLHNKSTPIAMQSKVKESKVKESKEEKNTPVFTPSVNQNELLIKKWYEWVEFRRLLKKPYKTTPGAAAAYNKLLRLADSDSGTAISIIDQSIENEWLGFFPLKIKPISKSIPGEGAIQRMVREMKEREKLEEHGNN